MESNFPTRMFFYSFLSFSCRRLSNIDFIYSHDFTCFNIVIVSKNSSISVWDDDDDDGDDDDDDDDAKLTLWSRQRVIGSSHFISFSWMPDVGSLQESTPWIFRFQHEDLPFGDQGYGWAGKPGLLCLTSAEKMMKKWRTRSSLLKTSMQSSKNLRCHLNSWAHNLSERYASKTDVYCMSSGQFFAIAEYPMNSEDIWAVYSDICTDWCITERYLFHDSRSNKIMIRHLQTSNEYKFQFMIN